MLLGAGICSVFERVLLACTQQRQSPANATAFGVANLVADGLKLFSKLATDFSSRQIGVVMIGLFAGFSVIVDLAFCRSATASVAICHVIEILMLAEVGEFLILVLAITNRNHFVDIALARLFEVSVLAELVFSVCAIIVIGHEKYSTISSLTFSSWLLESWIIVTLIFSGFLLHVGKVPFDLVEAESELIDGITTDLGTGLFSAIYAAETIAMLVGTKFLALVFHTFSTWI